MKLLEHHVQVIKSREFLEDLRGHPADKQRSPDEVATEIVRGLASQERYSPMLKDPQTFAAFHNLFSQAVESYRAGKLEEVGDFQVKRDDICNVCGVKNCWRKDDSLSLREAIEKIRASL